MPYRPFRVRVGSAGDAWTVVGDDYELHGAADRFLMHLRFGRDLSDLTVKAYAGDLSLLLTWGERTARDAVLMARELHAFVLHLRTTPIASGRGAGRPRSPSRINHVLVVAREYFKFLAAHDLVPGEVLRHLFEVADDTSLPQALKPEGGGLAYYARPRHKVRTERRAHPEVVNWQEFEAVLAAATSWRDRFLLVLLYFTGLRRGQAMGLRGEDIHFTHEARQLDCGVAAGPHLHVVRRDNPNGALAKSRQGYHVPAPGPVLQFHERYLLERTACRAAAATAMLFVNLDGPRAGAPMRPDYVNTLLTRISRRAGVRALHPHMFRHAAATEMRRGGAPLDVIQRVLGHSSIESTGVYARVDEHAMREAVDGLARARALPCPQ